MTSDFIFANNVSTTLTESISATATVINVAPGTGASFPTIVGSQVFGVTLVDAATGLKREICYCTARSGDALTVIRGQESTNAVSWQAGDTAAHYITAGALGNFVQSADLSPYATQAWVNNQGYATQVWVTNQGYATQAWVNAQGYATQTWVTNQNYIINNGGTSGGITRATIDSSTSSPSFLDGNGTWHVVQPSGSYLVTNSSSSQNVSGPVAFSGTTTATTLTLGDYSTKIATTAFATPGKLLQVSPFTSSGSYYPPRNDTTLIFKVRAVAAGGGGASTPQLSSYQGSSGGGGGSGAYCEVWLTWAQLFQGSATSLGVSIGGGGSANYDGGNTTVGAYITCYGGKGAPTANSGGYTTISGGGGSSSAPDITNGYKSLVASAQGSPGQPGFCTNPQNGSNLYTLSGSGASSPFGSGGTSQGIWTNGTFGGIGGGGAGACSNRTTSGNATAQTGGTGGNGFVVIEAYERIPY